MYTVQVVLECVHVRLFDSNIAPQLGETIWCPSCAEYRKIAAAPDNWRVRCVRGCSFSRPYGADMRAADAAAHRHHESKPTHRVRLYNGKRAVAEYGGAVQAELPGMNTAEPIPF